MKALKITSIFVLATLCGCNSKQNTETTDSASQQSVTVDEQSSAASAQDTEEKKKEEANEPAVKCEFCHDTREVACSGCDGEGFIYIKNESKGENWGRACFDCGGRGSSYKNDEDVTLGTGKIPCPECVTEIEVKVPQSSNEKIMETVPAALENKLEGNHNLRLQWISDTKFGKVEIAKIGDGKYECYGSQTGEGNDHLKIEGVLNVVNEKHLVFTGIIECEISHIHHGIKYIRNGVMDFENTKNRKFWRLQQMENGDCVDYVDIFIDKQK